MAFPKNLSSGQGIDLEKAKLHLCNKCGCSKFVKDIEIRIISAILSPTGQEVAVGTEVYSCKNCGETLSLEKTTNKNDEITPGVIN